MIPTRSGEHRLLRQEEGDNMMCHEKGFLKERKHMICQILKGGFDGITTFIFGYVSFLECFASGLVFGR